MVYSYWGYPQTMQQCGMSGEILVENLFIAVGRWVGALRSVRNTEKTEHAIGKRNWPYIRNP